MVRLLKGNVLKQACYVENRLRAFWKGGILPYHAIGLRRFVMERGYTLGARYTKRMAGVMNLLGLPAKPGGWGIFRDEAGKIVRAIKTNVFGIATDTTRTFKPHRVRGDYDLAAIFDEYLKPLENQDVTKLLPDLNQAVTGKRDLTQFMHETHWTYYDAVGIGRSGKISVFKPDGTLDFMSDTDFASIFGLPWLWKK